MKDVIFLPMQRVTLMMPASEAMMACKRAGTEVACIVRYTYCHDRTWQPVVYWENERGNEYASGYTLGECGIFEHGLRPYVTLNGQQWEAGDGTPEEYQQKAADISARLAHILFQAGARRIGW
jgi:hypothetical protein